jgi:ParB family transcriptional regulator, chromosome partitioning protein
MNKPRPNVNECCATTKPGALLRVCVANWLKTFIARKSAPKGAHRFVFAELAVDSYRLRDAFDKQHRIACELLDREQKALIAAMDDASDARAQMIVLALVLSAHEARLGVHT